MTFKQITLKSTEQEMDQDFINNLEKIAKPLGVVIEFKKSKTKSNISKKTKNSKQKTLPNLKLGLGETVLNKSDIYSQNSWLDK